MWTRKEISALSDTESAMWIQAPLMEISDGLLYNAEVISHRKGDQGQPGELAGVIHYSDGYRIGRITENTKKGITVPSQDFLFWQSIWICMRSGTAREVQTGPAVIISMVDGRPKRGSILRYRSFGTMSKKKTKE